jgi:hypothetical protein
MRRRRLRWAALLGLTSAATLSGCYYDPYTGYFYPYPPPYYPYGAPPPYYPYGALPQPSAAPPPAGNAPVQQTPLPAPR